MAAPPVVDLPVADERLAEDISAGLAAVEKQIRSAVESDDAFVTDASKHLIEAGGKRFRAMLVLLAAQFGDPTAPGVIPGAVVMELTHVATLYHDDVMDEATERRGKPSANARYNNTVAILTGDYVFAQAADIMADLGPEPVRIQAKTFARLVRGQIRETVGPAEGADPIEHYIDVLADKTGSLISTSARLGAMLAGAPHEVVLRLTSACEAIGVAFQLGDDIIDVASDVSGKTPGTDLREGIRTLPVLYALASTSNADARLRSLVSAPVPETDIEEALELLRASEALKMARAELARWADRAKSQLADLPDIPARAALLSLCDFVVERSA